jgi:PLD-like domain
VDVRGLVWRSHWDRLSFSGAENRHRVEALQANDDIEDQYLWSPDVAQAFVESLRRNTELRVIAVLPHLPDQNHPLSLVPQQYGRIEALSMMTEAAGDRVAAYGIENHAGTQVYVHAKIRVMDDWWATVRSDNFSRRSWTHDSELSVVVLDTTGGDHGADARRLRLTLAAEHLDRKVGAAEFPGDISGVQTGTAPGDLDDAALLQTMADCVAPQGMFDAFASSAARLQAWVDNGRQGARPPGPPTTHPRSGAVDAETAVGSSHLPGPARPRRTSQAIT